MLIKPWSWLRIPDCTAVAELSLREKCIEISIEEITYIIERIDVCKSSTLKLCYDFIGSAIYKPLYASLSFMEMQHPSRAFCTCCDRLFNYKH